MPKYKIEMKCQLESVTDLEVPDDNFPYQVKLRCNHCNEVSEKWQYVSAEELVEIPGSRGHCNYLAKCKLCHRPGSLDVLTHEKSKYCLDDVPKYKTIIQFECRGLAISDFRFGEGWQCKGAESTTKFQDVDLSEDWCDYDDNSKCPVSICELEFKIT